MRIDRGVKELVQVIGRNAADRFLAGNDPFIHHFARDAHRRVAGALASPRLQHVELAALNGELHVLHVAEVPLQQARGALELTIGRGHAGGERVDGLRCAHAGYHVLALRVDQVFAVEPVLPGGRVPGEGDAGARVLADVAEHHRDHVDGRAHGVGNVVQVAIVDGPLGVPAREHGRHRAPQLLDRRIGEVVTRLLLHSRLEGAHDLLQHRHRQVDIPGHASRTASLVEHMLEGLLRQVEDDAGVHLHEAAVAVPRERGVAAL